MGRRGNGEGTITRRKDGRWEAKYTAHTAEGPKRRALYGKTRKEAAEKLLISAQTSKPRILAA